MAVTFMPSAPIVRIVATSKAGFMLTVPLRELFTRWSLITGCWPVWSQEQALRLFHAQCWKVCRGITRLKRGPLAEQWRWLTTWLVWRRGAKTRPLEAFIQLLDAPDSAKQGYQ